MCDRVASSTLLEDRRDAVRALKSLSKVINASSFPIFIDKNVAITRYVSSIESSSLFVFRSGLMDIEVLLTHSWE